jgi:hypothetical protein
MHGISDTEHETYTVSYVTSSLGGHKSDSLLSFFVVISVPPVTFWKTSFKNQCSTQMTLYEKEGTKNNQQKKPRKESIRTERNTNTHRKEVRKPELMKELGHEFPSFFIEVKTYEKIEAGNPYAPHGKERRNGNSVWEGKACSYVLLQ